jgi:hypothetical protein
LFAAADGYSDFGGVELIAGPFPVPRIVGGLMFVKPLGLWRRGGVGASHTGSSENDPNRSYRLRVSDSDESVEDHHIPVELGNRGVQILPVRRP